MLKQIVAISLKELKIVLRDKGVLSVLFLLPIIFTLLMTFAGVGNQGTRDVKILVLNQDRGPIASRVVERLKHEKGLVVVDKLQDAVPTEASAEAALLGNGSDYAFVLAFPANFSEGIAQPTGDPSKTPVVRFIADPGTGGTNLNPVERLVEIQIMNVAGAFAAGNSAQKTLTDLVSKTAMPENPALAQLAGDFAKRMKTIDTQIGSTVQFKQVPPKGMVMTRPLTAEDQNLPGYTIFGIFFIVQVIGTTLLREKEDGTFNRLMAAPIKRSVILLGKLIPFYLINLFQVVFMFGFGWLVFHISFGNSILGLFLVSLATAAVANALGLFIASISKTAEQMGPLSGLILISLATVGGIFIPSFEMPKILQTFSRFTPHAWALKGFQDILVRGYDAVAVLPTVGVLMIFTVVLYVLALLRFRVE